MWVFSKTKKCSHIFILSSWYILTLDIDRPESYNCLGIRFTRNNKIADSICERINMWSFYFSNKTMKSFVCINHDKTAYHNYAIICVQLYRNKAGNKSNLLITSIMCIFFFVQNIEPETFNKFKVINSDGMKIMINGISRINACNIKI